VSTAAKRKGAQFEVGVRDYLRSLGLDAERLHLAGAKDEGDIVVKIGGVPFILECKATQAADLSGWVKEAEIEAGHYAAARNIEPVHFAALWKRRMYPISKSYIIVPVDEWLEQVRPPF